MTKTDCFQYRLKSLDRKNLLLFNYRLAFIFYFQHLSSQKNKRKKRLNALNEFSFCFSFMQNLYSNYAYFNDVFPEKHRLGFYLISNRSTDKTMAKLLLKYE
jgi:hypothetical protein